MNVYRKWLVAALEYYYPTDEHLDNPMSDELWTLLAQQFYRDIDNYPFLKEIGFNGTTLGCGVSKEQIEAEIERSTHEHS